MKSQHIGRTDKLRYNQHQNDEQSGQSRIDPQHRRVELGGSAVAVAARFECQKAVDGAKLKAGIRDKNKIARCVNGKPGRKHLVRPEVQKDGDQRNLLRNPQHHLEKVRRPSFKESSRAAWGRNAHRGLPIVASMTGAWIKVTFSRASQTGYQPAARLSIVGQPRDSVRRGDEERRSSTRGSTRS